MLTKNWYNMAKAYRKATTISNAAKDIKGNVRNAGHYASMACEFFFFKTSTVALAENTNNVNIVLGSGTTPATIDDYMLESWITSGLSCVITSELDDDNDTIWTITATNTSQSEIVIGEVGIHAKAYYGNNSVSNTATFLFERTVLETPITIAPGGVGQVTYKIKMNYPTT